MKPWSRSVIGSSANVSVRRERTTPWQCSSARLQRAEALLDLARLDRVVRGLHDQPDAGDALLRPVVQREREAPALALLDAQQLVGEAAALALAQLGLDAQRLGERERRALCAVRTAAAANTRSCARSTALKGRSGVRSTASAPACSDGTGSGVTSTAPP